MRIPSSAKNLLGRRIAYHESANAYRSGCAPVRGGAAAALRGDRTGGVPSHRRTGPARPRRHPLRERRFPDRRHARPGGPSRHASRLGQSRPDDRRSDPRARHRLHPRRRLRRDPLPHRLSCVSLRQSVRDADGAHAPRAAGSRIPAGAVPPLRPDAAGVHQRRAARAPARPRAGVGGHGVPRSAPRGLPVRASGPGLPGFPGPPRTREAAGRGDRGRAAGRYAAEDRGQGGRRRPGVLRARDGAAARRSTGRVHR